MSQDSPHPRHDFSAATKTALYKRVGMLCSFDVCERLTIRPGSKDSESVASIGVACHIHAAAPGGPRYDASQTEDARRHIDNGIWMCSDHAKLIDVDESGYSPDLLRQWKAAAEIRAAEWQRTGRMPRKHAEPALGPFLFLEQWVSAHWGATVGDGASLFPAWEEFATNRVYMETEAATRTRKLLTEGRLALVSGHGGCGKSVFSIACALAWQRAKAGIVLWLDLRDEGDGASDTLKEVLAGFAHWTKGPLLLVIDNAHLDPILTQWLRDELMYRRLALPHCHVLLTARPAASSVPDRLSILAQLAPHTVHLEATAAALEGVTQRLCARTQRTVPWNAASYADWVKQFGGDLIAFSQAVGAALGKRIPPAPKVADAAAYVRERYLKKAGRSEAGTGPFLRLCALATLDLSACEIGLGGAFDALYRDLAKDGLATHQVRGSYDYWQCQHAGLGELVLQAACTRDEPFESLRLRYLNDYLEQTPHAVFWVAGRLQKTEYATRETYELWRRGLWPELIEDAVTHNPVGAAILGPSMRLDIDWASYLTKRKYHLPDRLMNKPPHFAVRFLKYMGDPHSELLLPDLLEKDYVQVLAQTPPQFVVTFLKYVGDGRGQELLDALLSGDYVQVLAQTPPGDVVTFLKYVGEKRAQELLDALLLRDYVQVLAQTPPHFVVTFLKYVGEKRAKPLLVDLLSEDYVQVLAQTPPDSVVSFLRYVGEKRGRVYLQLLLGEGYLRFLLQTTLNNVVPFLRLTFDWVAEGQPEVFFKCWLAEKLDGPFDASMLNDAKALCDLIYDVSPDDFRHVQAWLDRHAPKIRDWLARANTAQRVGFERALATYGLSLGGTAQALKNETTESS